ncbi:oxidoreductase [Niveibacterium terrae]|uniref:oxidoreductase n=1 Tax=Niveibacterium terrae TaxID=3373598 RepID=UPI003A9539A3
MSQALRVGLVGYGYASKTFHAPLIAAVPGLKLTAIASSDPAKVHADWPDLAVEPSPQALFDRPDIALVVIPTPNETHFPLAQAALAAGKHVVVDKPFTVTLAEARELDELARSSGRMLSVFHNRRWDADFLTLKRVLASGELGRIVHFESHFDRYRPQVRARWREESGPGSGLWYDLGSHLLDQALHLFGLPDAISLDLANQREGASVDDWFHALLRYGRCRVILHGGAVVPVPAARFTVHGSLGSFVKLGLDPQEEALKLGHFPPRSNWGVDPREAELTVWRGAEAQSRWLRCERGDYPAYYAAVRDAIHGAGPNPVSAADAIRVIGLLELGLQSARERREIPVVAGDFAPQP